MDISDVVISVHRNAARRFIAPIENVEGDKKLYYLRGLSAILMKARRKFRVFLEHMECMFLNVHLRRRKVQDLLKAVTPSRKLDSIVEPREAPLQRLEDRDGEEEAEDDEPLDEDVEILMQAMGSFQEER